MITFEAWPKTPRLNRDNTTITEKIDGTNAAVIIQKMDFLDIWGKDVRDYGAVAWVPGVDDHQWVYLVGAQSRKRLLSRSSDNYGFAHWVLDNASELVALLGVGRHFGEWWGQGIQRRYGMNHKVFSLFNYHRFSKLAQEWHDWRNRAKAIYMTVVPLLGVGKFSDILIQDTLDDLRWGGSVATAEWGVQFDRPEGIIIRHAELGGNMKVLLENDDVPKSLQ